ncbi:DUF6325 family protein [Microbacterium sp. KR10-403]|uniref:DUF6325 family protein n=1 Tax=Microbacterium sp. KR10-403 TaxID=3158581 RepID=UPI0032E375A5
MATEAFAGPVDYVVFAFPAGSDASGGLSALLERVAAGALEVLDLECVGKDAAGAGVRLELSSLVGADAAAPFAGAESGVLDDDDRAEIAASLEEGGFAIAVVYEDRSLAPVADAWAAVGASELFSGGVAIDDLSSAVEEGAES